MKQTIPFKKDITFKTKIGELTSISLDNDLMLKGEDLISGNFYISGSYKMLESSTITEEYSYKIPCEIAISEEYDTYDATIDIDDFYYEIIDDEILRINIVLVIDNLKRKEENTENEQRCIEDDPEFEEQIKQEYEAKIEEKYNNYDKNKKEKNSNNISFLKAKEEVQKQNDTYLTYKVYIFKDGDNLENILEKYNITKEALEDYNDLENIKSGSKLVIPSFNDKL